MPVTLPEVVRQLSTLTPEHFAEVYDFVLFLKTRPVATVEENDEWSDADQHDATAASLRYSEAALAAEEEVDD